VAYFLLSVLVAIVLGVIGATAGGLGCLLIVGISQSRIGRQQRREPRRPERTVTRASWPTWETTLRVGFPAPSIRATASAASRWD
jgi:hypothetical protein